MAPFPMVGLLLAVAACVYSLWRLRIDHELLRQRFNVVFEETVVLRRRLEELEHTARMSEVALVGKHLRQTLAEYGYAVLPDGVLHDIRDEPRPNAWEHLTQEPEPAPQPAPESLPDKPQEPA